MRYKNAKSVSWREKLAHTLQKIAFYGKVVFVPALSANTKRFLDNFRSIKNLIVSARFNSFTKENARNFNVPAKVL